MEKIIGDNTGELAPKVLVVGRPTITKVLTALVLGTAGVLEFYITLQPQQVLLQTPMINATCNCLQYYQTVTQTGVSLQTIASGIWVLISIIYLVYLVHGLLKKQ